MVTVTVITTLLWLWTFSTFVIIDANQDKNDATTLPFQKEWRRPPQPRSVGLRHLYRTVDLLTLLRNHRSMEINPNNDDDDDDVQELYFTQMLDHYRGDDNRTFQQRYFRSDRFMRHIKTNPNSVAAAQGTEDSVTIVLLCVGGEGPALDASVLRNSVHCTGDMIESAQTLYHTYPQWSIILIAFEHRYYGKSYPTFDRPDHNTTKRNSESSPVTNENLIYLSSRQATADLANFIHTMFHYQNKYLVYVFGGSYPGMMAAYTRTKYPYLIRGAMSHSAPVQAVLNFDTYQSHVGYNLQQIDVNCYNIVTMGHLAITQILQQNISTKIQALAKQFHLCHSDTVLLNPENQNLFVGDGVMYFGAQENDPHCNSNNNNRNEDDTNNYCNMEQKCIALTTQYTKEMNDTNATIESAAINALAYLAKIQQQQMQHHVLSSNTDDSNDATANSNDDDDDCFVVDWEETLKYIADPILGQADGLRSWLYQTCTEFGFYQTCLDHKCPFGIGYHTLQQDLYICQYAFDIYNTAQAVQNTNEWTGGWENIEQTSRIFSVTGTVDPWSEMAIQHHTSSSSSQDPIDYPKPYQVPGASHHFWTHPSQETDDETIVAARQKIYQTLHDWIVSDIENYYTNIVAAAQS